MKRIVFFITKNDIFKIFDDIEQVQKLKFVGFGPLRKHDIHEYHSYRDIPDFGIATEDQSSACKSYLAAKQQLSFDYNIVGEGSNIFYSFTQLFNEETVIVRTGGKFGEDTIISGEISTIHDNRETAELMKVMQKAIKTNCTKVKAFWVGEEALKMLQSGKRLTMAVQSPPEYDLSIT